MTGLSTLHLRRLIALLVLAGVLAACGARGPPQPPPGTQPPGSKPSSTKPQPKDEPFILDPLIK
jgi:predicted small lipoprotein YifL